MKRALLTAVLVAATTIPSLGVAAAAPAQTSIQPGAQIFVAEGTCTMNFVFQRSGLTYIGTAGHCVKLGERPTRSNGAEFGTVVYQENQQPPGIDFALIRVDSAFVSQVEPSVRTYGGPVGYTVASETASRDQLLFTGYGLGFGSLAATRDRTGILMSDDADEYVANLPAVNGDSGGPILHARTGKALGIISRFNVPNSTDIGPTMPAILARVRGAGFTGLALVTAPRN